MTEWKPVLVMRMTVDSHVYDGDNGCETTFNSFNSCNPKYFLNLTYIFTSNNCCNAKILQVITCIFDTKAVTSKGF